MKGLSVLDLVVFDNSVLIFWHHDSDRWNAVQGDTDVHECFILHGIVVSYPARQHDASAEPPNVSSTPFTSISSHTFPTVVRPTVQHDPYIVPVCRLANTTVENHIPDYAHPSHHAMSFSTLFHPISVNRIGDHREAPTSETLN